MSLKRLLTSRKIWGAILASVFIVIVVIVADVTTAPVAISALSALWLMAIGGQAFKDYKGGGKKTASKEIGGENPKDEDEEDEG